MDTKPEGEPVTAEVAILNKSAVALAADSAVTISAGSNQQKIYDSADKLFELSNHDPIGVMVNGDMNFMQIPLAVLVKKFREQCARFKHVPNAASDFIDFLLEYGVSAPDAIKRDYIRMAVTPPFEKIKNRTDAGFLNRIFTVENDGDDMKSRLENLRAQIFSEQIEVMKSALSRQTDALFTGLGDFIPNGRDSEVVREVIDTVFNDLTDQQRADLEEVSTLALKKRGTGPTSTGIVVAGFGADDLFPTLVPYEIHGVVGDRLKYWKGSTVDIDRVGTRAKVMPFAQREMVERFLHGLDEGIRRNITAFCRTAVPKIREKILESLEIADDDLEPLRDTAEAAENAFLDGLASESFEAIRLQSQEEIEDMVEFMPKPELARMAEALVNLTSIKRRVSRGMETVGGPIDVAIISKAEGFVWVQRKHYFRPELNSRFFDRKRVELDRGGDGDDTA